MPVPAKRRSRSKARRGRAHFALKKLKLKPCSQCHKIILPHTVCNFCGTYKGRKTITVKTKAKKTSSASSGRTRKNK